MKHEISRSAFIENLSDHKGQILQTCSGCLLWTDTFQNGDATGRFILQFSKSCFLFWLKQNTCMCLFLFLFLCLSAKTGQIDPKDIELFKEQAECLNFPKNFHSYDSKTGQWVFLQALSQSRADTATRWRSNVGKWRIWTWICSRVEKWTLLLALTKCGPLSVYLIKKDFVSVLLFFFFPELCPDEKETTEWAAVKRRQLKKKCTATCIKKKYNLVSVGFSLLYAKSF